MNCINNYELIINKHINNFEVEVPENSNSGSNAILNVFQNQIIDSSQDNFDLCTQKSRVMFMKYGLRRGEWTGLEQRKKFYETHKAVAEIDKLIRSLHNNEQEIVSVVRQTLLISDHENMMAELGMILFYLDRDRCIPQTDRFVAHRAEEMLYDIESFIKNHTLSKASSLIPTGKIHYILNAFAQMAVTSERVYNTGGVRAIRELLTSPEYSMTLHLQPEHLQHILNVSESLLSERAKFSTLFQKKILIHPDMEVLIRLDLKLPPTERITPPLIILASLISLFADVRQKSSPNCYAIASVRYISETDPYKFISKTFEWLREGCFSSEDRYSVPLMQLAINRLSSNQVEMNACLNSYEIAPFAQISHALDLALPDPMDESPFSIRKAISRIINANRAGAPDERYARQLYHSYKSPLIVLLHIIVCELNNFNRLRPNEVKYRFLKNCIDSIYLASDPQLPSKDIIQKCGENFCKHIWLVDKEDPITPKKFKNSLSALIWAEDGRVYPVSTITHLQNTLRSIVDLTATQVTAPFANISMIKNAIATDRFRTHFTNRLSEQYNGYSRIHPNELNAWNILALPNEGGYLCETLNTIYNIPLTTNQISNWRTPYQLLRVIYEFLDDQMSPNLLSMPRTIINAGSHIWTLDPYVWKELIEYQNGFDQFIQCAVFNPARRCLGEIAREEIIYEVVGRGPTYISPALFSNRPVPLTNRGFIQGFLQNLRSCDVPWGEEIIQDVYASRSLCKRSLTQIFRYLNIEVSSDTFHEIYDCVAENFTYPYIIASKLRKLLIKHHIAILHPYDVEKAVCRATGCEISILLGDSNWVNEDNETPSHREFAIRYHYAAGTLCIVERRRESEIILSNEQLEEMCILYNRDQVGGMRL